MIPHMANETTIPKRLWKYRKWNDHARAMIETGEVKFSTFSEINDPFEGTCWVKFSADSTELDRYVREVLAQDHPDDSIPMRTRRYKALHKDFQDKLGEAKGNTLQYKASNRYGLFSVADHCDDILMWSHYGYQHRGVCIAVLPERFAPKVFRQVRYVQKIPIATAWEFLGGSYETFQKIALSKSVAWEYEREWRTAMEPGVRCFPECVERMVVGALAAEDTRREVDEAVKNSSRRIQIHEAHLSDVRFEVTIEPPIPG